jgi:Protein of unknown function (DUF2782)
MRGINKPTQLTLGMSVAGLLCAAEPEVPQGLESLSDVPELSARVQSGEALELPNVRIVPKKDVTIEEYRISGRLYRIKVIPVKGPPYYFLDPDGDYRMETKMSEIYSDFVVPSWVLFSW